jgi:hypothetical protein
MIPCSATAGTLLLVEDQPNISGVNKNENWNQVDNRGNICGSGAAALRATAICADTGGCEPDIIQGRLPSDDRIHSQNSSAIGAEGIYVYIFMDTQ